MTDVAFEAAETTDDDAASSRRSLPVLPLKETVVFPQSMTPLAIGQERSVRLIDDVVAGERLLALVTVARLVDRDARLGRASTRSGRRAVVHKMIKVPDGTLRILVQGLAPRPPRRAHLRRPVPRSASSSARPDVLVETPEVEALTRNVQGQFARIIGLAPYLPEELQLAAANVDDPSALCHLVASTLRTIKTEERQEVLEQVDVEQRLRDRLGDPDRELEVFELGSRRSSRRCSRRWRRASGSTSCASS